MKAITFFASCVLATSSLPTGLSFAADTYPNKSITLVAPYNPGGSYDTVARILANELTERWGEEVIVENRPGAGSLIGTEVAARAEPDGHTLVIFGNNHAILPSVHKNASFNVQEDFEPVALVATVPAVLLVHPSVEARSVTQFVSLAKAHPGAMNFGSGGNGSSTHLGLEMFAHAAGIDIVHIPYQAGVPATMDLIAGETQIGLLNVVSAKGHVESGALRPIAITTDEPSPDFPDVKTMADSGLPNYEYIEWYGIAVPAGTPADVIAKLNSTINDIMVDPEIQERFAEMGAKPLSSTPEEFGDLLASEIEKNSDAVERAGLGVD